MMRPLSKIKFTFVIAVLLFTSNFAVSNAIGAADYIGVGYNIITSNFDYEDSTFLHNSKPVLAPNSDKISVIGGGTCSSQELNAPHASVFEGTLSYQSKIRERVTISEPTAVLLGGYEFSKSKSYDFISVSTNDMERVFHQSQLICNEEEASLVSSDGVLLSQEFINDVLILPTSYIQRDYMEFVNRWGTDVITAISLGIKSHIMYQTSQLKVVQQSVKMQSYVIDNNGRVVVDMDNTRQNLTLFPEIFNEHAESVSVGSDDHPALTEVTLISITEAFDEKYWESFEHDATALAAKRMNLFIALSEYPVWMSATQSSNPVLKAEVTWPMGIYSLPMVDNGPGCPNSAFYWKTGYRFQDTEDVLPSNDWSNPFHLEGPYGWNNVQHNFCTKVNSQEDDNNWEWMRGQYCIYRRGGSCPTGFSSGHVLWDDETILNSNDVAGVLPDGVYDSNTKIYFCCRDDGPTDVPILLPTTDTFALVQKNTECQQVQGMSVSAEWFHYDGADGFGHNKEYFGGSHPYNSGRDNDHTLHYCYYY